VHIVGTISGENKLVGKFTTPAKYSLSRREVLLRVFDFSWRFHFDFFSVFSMVDRIGSEVESNPMHLVEESIQIRSVYYGYPWIHPASEPPLPPHQNSRFGLPLRRPPRSLSNFIAWIRSNPRIAAEFNEISGYKKKYNPSGFRKGQSKSNPWIGSMDIRIVHPPNENTASPEGSKASAGTTRPDIAFTSVGSSSLRTTYARDLVSSGTTSRIFDKCVSHTNIY